MYSNWMKTAGLVGGRSGGGRKGTEFPPVGLWGHQKEQEELEENEEEQTPEKRK